MRVHVGWQHRRYNAELAIVEIDCFALVDEQIVSSLGRHWDDRLLRDRNVGEARYSERPILQLFVLMISSAMVVATSTTITVLRGDIKSFSRENLASGDGFLVLGAGVALVIAVVFYFLALSEGADQHCRPDLRDVYRRRRCTRAGFPA